MFFSPVAKARVRKDLVEEVMNNSSFHMRPVLDYDQALTIYIILEPFQLNNVDVIEQVKLENLQ